MQHKDPQLMKKIRLFAMNYYREHNQMPSIRTIADGTGMNRGSVQKYLVEMQERGIIEYDGKIHHIHASKAPTESKDTYNAGIIGSIACGIPEDVEEYVEEYVPLPVSIFGHVITLSAGKLTTFIGYVDTLIWPMIAMGQILQMHSRFKTSSGRIYAFLDQEEEIHNAENAVVLKDCKGKITFKDFSFAYPDGDTHSLKNVTFEIQPGEMVGLVGKIGSGKTTLVNTLLRLYNIEKGKIFIDDIDLMDIDITSLRDAIAYVPQDNFLFSDNIKNNISFANNKADMNDIRNAAKFADVDDNILGFSEGYETVTGERGVTLSGGQKQRISIARAYMKNAPIMIMDDSVSAVDVKTEETILNNINEKRKGKTTIIIASRVSTVAHMDKILVLNDGCVEAFDTPANLLNTSPTYQKMVYLQKLESEL